MKSYFYVFKLFEKSLKRGTELPLLPERTEKELFYLNDFYDLLYEKENTIQKQGLNPAEYFEREKYYTMGPGIDFPMIMSYKDTENPTFEPYFYFLNGHNDVVYFADSNFTEDQTESYEYNPWGVLLTQANKNNLLYTAREFDFDINLQFNRMRYYSASLGRFIQKDFLFYYFPQNLYTYSFNLPSIYSDPFGLMPPWLWTCVNLKIPSLGGGIWIRDRCEEPAYEEDCFKYCGGNISACKSCCANFYAGETDTQPENDCKERCEFI